MPSTPGPRGTARLLVDLIGRPDRPELAGLVPKPAFGQRRVEVVRAAKPLPPLERRSSAGQDASATPKRHNNRVHNCRRGHGAAFGSACPCCPSPTSRRVKSTVI